MSERRDVVSVVDANAGHSRGIWEIFTEQSQSGFGVLVDIPTDDSFADAFFGCFIDNPSSAAFPSVVAVVSSASDSLHGGDVDWHKCPVVGVGVSRPCFGGGASLRSAAEITLLVRNGWQRRGIGKSLLDGLADRLRDRGVSHIVTAVASVNKEALSFHSRVGFSEVGRFSNIGERHSTVFDVVWFQKDIPMSP